MNELRDQDDIPNWLPINPSLPVGNSPNMNIDLDLSFDDVQNNYTGQFYHSNSSMIGQHAFQ